jgi:hypothetical protein
MLEQPMALSFVQPITLFLSLLQRMASNDDNNDKCKIEEEAESSMTRKRLQPSYDDNGGDDSSDSPEEEEVSSEETLMNQLNTSEEKLFATDPRKSLALRQGEQR